MRAPVMMEGITRWKVRETSRSVQGNALVGRQAIDDFSDRLAQPVTAPGTNSGQIKCIDEDQHNRDIGVLHYGAQNLAMSMGEQLVIKKRSGERDVELALQKTVQQFLGKFSVTAI